MTDRRPLDNDTMHCYRLTVEAAQLLHEAANVALNSDDMDESLWGLLRTARRSVSQARTALAGARSLLDTP